MEYQLLGWLSRNPNSKIPAICIAMGINVDQAWEIIEKYMKKVIICGRGYASHTEEYYVTKTISDEQLGMLLDREKQKG